MGQHTWAPVMLPPWVLPHGLVVHAQGGLRFLAAWFPGPPPPTAPAQQAPGHTQGSVAAGGPGRRMGTQRPLDEPPSSRGRLPVLPQPAPLARACVEQGTCGACGDGAAIPQRRRAGGLRPYPGPCLEPPHAWGVGPLEREPCAWRAREAGANPAWRPAARRTRRCPRRPRRPPRPLGCAPRDRPPPSTCTGGPQPGGGPGPSPRPTAVGSARRPRLAADLASAALGRRRETRARESTAVGRSAPSPAARQRPPPPWPRLPF
jgi:hypothetical protein